jgi:hypothetical protein
VFLLPGRRRKEGDLATIAVDHLGTGGILDKDDPGWGQRTGATADGEASRTISGAGQQSAALEHEETSVP